jgi:hypothetical protein
MARKGRIQSQKRPHIARRVQTKSRAQQARLLPKAIGDANGRRAHCSIVRGLWTQIGDGGREWDEFGPVNGCRDLGMTKQRHTCDASDMSLFGSRPAVKGKLQWRFGDVLLLVGKRICLGSHDLSE